ncbi:MAG: helix-turn-helix domain-containing protein [Pseudonocardia sp.]
MTGGCPAWLAAASTVEAALRSKAPVLVLGESGTGRTTLLADLFARLHDGGRAVSLSADAVEAAPQDIADRLTRTSSRPILHILRDVDSLSTRTAEILAAALGQHPLHLAATATDGGRPDAPYHPLLAVFRASATVPPLRHRGSAIQSLVESVLADLAPRREVRLSRDALRVVGQYHWPGNVRQLVDALTSALRRRPVGRIEAEDLPAYCHSTPRHVLRPVDEIERDAIVAALREASGNRVAAAAALGLARSTLYRKIRHYGITA